jgi:RHS repeat-associated core domain
MKHLIVFLRRTFVVAAFCLLVHNAFAQYNQVPDEIEFQVLKNIYDSLGGDSWINKGNWPQSGAWPTSATSAQFATWEGVYVMNGDIFQMSLHGKNLEGMIPKSISQLSKLTILNLRYNKISGSIPDSFTNLSELTALILDNNLLTGSLPANIGNLQKLERLNVSVNQIAGNLPASLWNLTKLTELYVAANSLTGEIPSGLGNLVNLKYISLRNNQFSGSIPTSIQNLEKLETLYLANNLFSGTLPSELANLPAITVIEVTNNSLQGEPPSVENWPKLREYRIGRNQFSGNLPVELEQCNHLTALSIEANNLSSIPSGILNLPVLSFLNISNNNISSIPDFSAHINKANLVLNVSHNKLSFGDLERIYNKGIKTLTYSPQKDYDDVQWIDLRSGETLTITARDPGLNGSVTWERRLDGATTFTNINSVNEDQSQRTFVLSTISEAQDGSFRYSVTNSSIPGLTLKSEVIVARVGNPTVWNSQVGLTEDDGILTKSAPDGWGNAGATSENVLAPNVDGSIFINATRSDRISSYIIGFSSTTTYNATDIAYGIELYYNAGIQRVIVHESNATGIETTHWMLGDVFEIARQGNYIRYYKNGVVFRSVLVDPAIQYNKKVVLHSGTTPPGNCSFWIPASRGIVPDAWEYRALRELYDSLGGSQWVRKNSWPATTTKTINITAAQMNAWFGINIGSGDITAVELPSNRLIGKLPAAFGNLKRLTRLRIQDNSLEGPIPEVIRNFRQLTFLNIGRNNFTGQIPEWLGELTSLTWLSLHNNALEGEIPSSLFNLVNLQDLYIIHTNVTGVIPPEVGNLHKIKVLHLFQNKLTGSLPPEIFTLTTLTNLAVSNNGTLSGSIPEAIGNLTNLTELWLNGNDFSGQLPESFGNLNKMKYLQLSMNRLTGPLPASMSSMKSMEWAALALNEFSGPIPSWFGDMPLMDSLWLYGNNFTGELPENLKNATSLVILDVHNNKLEGALPLWLGNLNKLRTLRLGTNNFEGTIPPSLQNLNNIKNLNLSFTKLTGEIPDYFVSKTSLRWLEINDANFTGLPNFSTRSDRALLTILVQNNAIQLNDIEANFIGAAAHPFLDFTYQPQRNPFQLSSLSIPVGDELRIDAPDGGMHGIYEWERLINGVWTSINQLNEGADEKSFIIGSATEGTAGTYRYRVSNSWVTDLVFESGLIEVQITDAVSTEPIKPLYNGMITAVRWRTSKPLGVDGDEFSGMYVYNYDDKYQITDASWATHNAGLVSYSGNKFRLTGMEYDANGNIMKLKRYDGDQRRTNDFSYEYEPNKNKLLKVNGYVHQYQYNAVGQMTHEDKEEGGEDKYVKYDVSGKVIAVYAPSPPCTNCPPGNPVPDPDQPDIPQGYHLLIENLYDDRGFRLAKINYRTKLTTWYIRDASGNIISILEEQNFTGEAVETEVPIYGSGKLGAYYPQEDGSTNYEITDHLGNVRALLRDNVNVYTATMEDNGVEDVTNPRVEELAYFENLFETEKDNDRHMNVTPPSEAEPDPRKSAYLFWNDTPGSTEQEKAVGPSWAKKVSVGDKVDAKVWTRYEEKISFAKNFDLVVFSSLLANTFTTMVGFEGYSLPQTTASVSSGLLAPTFNDDDEDNERPYAYLNYLLFDENLNFVQADRFRVPEHAGSDQASLYLEGNKPVQMNFDAPVTITQNGYIYIWVSNESKEARVWFDDLTITHEEHIVVQATDYGVWGDLIREQKSDEALYRYGYQGQFSEKDEETGWNHFELREYDPVIGRWLQKDPMSQFFSPYIGMGNNPVHLTDPRGGCVDGQGNVIPCPDGVSDGMDGQHTVILADAMVSAGVSFDAMTFEYDYAGTFGHYQQSFPEFAGMSQREATAHWNSKYGEAFYKQWRESVQREKDRENVAKLAWFIQGFTTAGTMSLGALGGTSTLKGPNTFTYSPRYSLRYHPRIEGQVDTYHNFPYSFDKHIIRNGSWSQRIRDGANWYEMPGSVNGESGFYQIGINQGNTVFHRNFVPLSKY